MFRFNLSKDAFVSPPENKSILQYDFKSLYQGQPVVAEYFSVEKKPNNKTIVKKNYSVKFQEQFFILIDSLQAWGKTKLFVNEVIANKFKILKNNFFKEAYSGNQPANYFCLIKNYLEKIWYVLNFSKNHSDHLKKQVYLSLVRNLHVCAPGLYTHVETTWNQLNNDMSMERWLGEFRTNIIRLFSETHIQTYQIDPGYSIHVLNAFLVMALNEGFNPLSKLTQIDDPFAGGDIHLNRAVIENFFTHLVESYNPESILNCICTNVIYKLNEYKREFELKEDKEGFFTATNGDFTQKSNQLAEILELENANFYDITEDYKKIRFNPEFFKQILARDFYKKKKMFKTDLWKNVHFTTGEKLYLYNDEIGWFENSDKEIIVWNNIADKLQNISMILSQSPLKKWNLILKIMNISLQESVTNVNELIMLIAPINEESRLLNLMKFFLGATRIKEIMLSADEVFTLLDAFHFTDKWKVDLILKFCKKNYLLHAVQTNNASLKRLIQDSKKLPIQTECKDLMKLAKITVMNNHFDTLKILMDQYQIDLNETDRGGNTLLHIAAKENQPKFIQQLTQYYVDINKINKKGKTAAIIAVEEGHANVLRVLAECKADVNYKWKHSQLTLAHIAAQQDDQACLHVLAEFKADLNLTTTCQSGHTPAHLAVSQNNLFSAAALLKHHVSFQTPDKFGETALDLAIGCEFWNIVSLILKLETLEEVEGKAIEEHTAFVAVKKNCVRTLYELAAWHPRGRPFEKIAFAHLRNQNDETLVHVAAMKYKHELFPVLAELKVPFDQKNKDGNTAAHLILNADGQSEVILETINSLSQYFSDFLLPNKNGVSPIDIAYSRKNYQLVFKMLLIMMQKAKQLLPDQSIPHLIALKSYKNVIPYLPENKISLNVRDESGKTAVHIAVIAKDVAVIEYLIQYKANINLADNKGVTPLHQAALFNSPEIVDLLIKAGAQIDAADLNGNTPLHYAVKNNKEVSAKTLIDYKADFFIKDSHNEAFVDMLQEATPQFIHFILMDLIQSASWNNLMKILFWLKDISALAAGDLAALNEHRGELTDAVIDYISHRKMEDKNYFLDLLIGQKNALGIFLNKPVNAFFNFFSSLSRNGHTAEIYKIMQACNTPAPGAKLSFSSSLDAS